MEIGLGHLGWSPQTFWDASLSELLAAWEGYQEGERERQRRADFRMGNLMALQANMSRDPAKRAEPFAPSDFFFSLKRPEEEVEDEEPQGRELTPEMFATLNREPGDGNG